jgi:hypothetical protein
MVSGAGIIAKGEVVAQQQAFPSPTGIGRDLKHRILIFYGISLKNGKISFPSSSLLSKI